MYNEKFLVIGGDKRQKLIAESLTSKRFDVHKCALDNKKSNISKLIANSTVLILPIPCQKDEFTLNAPYHDEDITLEQIYTNINSGHKVFGGVIKQNFLDVLRGRGAAVYDYNNDEALTIFNAAFTAEGAIKIAIENSERTIWKSDSLVLGFGRIGKLLTPIISALGSRITVCARKAYDRAFVEAYGYDCCDFSQLPDKLYEFDYIFNTVPSLIMNNELLNYCKQNVCIIDLASKPGGVDFKYAKSKGIKAIEALSLPGKISPEMAAGFIEKSILNILKKEVYE